MWIQTAIDLRKCGWEKIFASVNQELSIAELQNIQRRSHELGQNGKDVFSFAIARDPILRFLSAYKSKAACDELHYATDVGTRSAYVKALLHEVLIYSAQVQIDSTRLFPFVLPNPLSAARCSASSDAATCCLRFHEFVDSILLRGLLGDAIQVHNRDESDVRKHIKLELINRHFRSQSDLCRYDALHYDEVHKMEELNNQTFRTLNDKLGNAIDNGGTDGSGHDGVRSVMVPKLEHASAHRNDTLSAPTEEELRYVETLLEKMRVYLERDYMSNDVLSNLYDYDTNRDMYIEAIHKILVAERSAGFV